MLVATSTFTADYDGETVEIDRGRTRVADDHDLARRFPDRFEPVPDTVAERWRARGVVRVDGQAVDALTAGRAVRGRDG